MGNRYNELLPWELYYEDGFLKLAQPNETDFVGDTVCFEFEVLLHGKYISLKYLTISSFVAVANLL